MSSEKVKIIVLIASHISYDGQIKFLSNAIKSILDNDFKSDIAISISFEDKFKYELVNLITTYKTIKWILQKDRKYQMEHIYILSKYVDDYDLVMFCDDDDTYNNSRIGAFAIAFIKTKNYKNIAGIKEVYDLIGYGEFWQYGVKPIVLQKFFIEKYLDLLKNKFADMLLRCYLFRIPECNFIEICEKLYNHNRSNPNSICATRSKNATTNGMLNKEFLHDQLFLTTIETNCYNKIL
jgi:hypothetical protein